MQITAPASEAPAVAPALEPGAPAATVVAPAAAPARPAWLPEKFATPEQMATAYGDLEKQFTTDRQTAPKVQSTAPITVAPVPTPAEATALLATKDLDMSKFVTEYTNNGKKISDASYAELAAKGIDKSFADNFITGQEAKAAQAADAILSTIGGRAEFDKATTWAKATLSADEITAFNNAVQTGTKADATMAVKGLHARFKSSNPSEPKLIGGNGSNSAEGFASTNQLTTAMRDPRYRNDPSYRADVERRVGASNLFGIG